jgi:Domain of unknown function (DUF4123)
VPPECPIELAESPVLSETRTPPVAALSAAQHKAQLWADAERQVYAVVMGSRVPDLPGMLGTADVVDHDCLLPGALPADVRLAAPYLVHLKRESAFTDWLLFQAAAGLGDWGVLVLGSVRRLVMRGHLRGLLQGRLPDGTVIDLDWMDPVILQALLPLFDGAGVMQFMGPVQSLVLPGTDSWTTADHALGQLQWRTVPLAKAA